MEDRQATLRAMRICRFCLTEKDPLSNIYDRDKNAIPLPLQIMACVTIEVFSNDGMPQLICDDCRLQTRKSYSFKTTCKKSDDALKLYLATGVLTKHKKEKILELVSVKKRRNDTEIQAPAEKRSKRQFSSDECNKTFFSKHELNKNAQIHSDEKPVVCSKLFNRTNILQRHEKTDGTVPKYLSTFCDKTYLSSTKLEAHMSVHEKNRPCKCEHCDKCFAFKQGLERHAPIHNPENPYKCDYSEESFTTAGKLALHGTSHSGSRRFPCKYCPRTFLLSHHLTHHLRNHNRKALVVEYGDFKCDFCSMSFNRKDSLINHTAIHSTANLKCGICNKEHVSAHLSGLPYPCDKCDYSFETQEELEDHKVKHVDDDDVNEPPKVRRFQRESKIKNYADFLKNEMEESKDIKPEVPIETIQQVIRSDTIKMYKEVKEKENKNVDQKLILPPIEPPKIVNDVPKSEMPKLELAPKSVTKITTLKNLGITKQTLGTMTDKSGFIEMKLGQKVIRVQKLKMTEVEYRAMSKKTKLEMKGSTVLLQNKGGLNFKKLAQLKGVINDPISDSLSKISESKVAIDPNVDVQLPKTPVRIYIKKTIVKKENLSQGNQNNEVVKNK